MTLPPSKKTWQTPVVEDFGSVRALTQEDSKLFGDFDNSDQDQTPLTQCPPPFFGTARCDPGIPAVS